MIAFRVLRELQVLTECDRAGYLCVSGCLVSAGCCHQNEWQTAGERLCRCPLSLASWSKATALTLTDSAQQKDARVESWHVVAHSMSSFTFSCQLTFIAVHLVWVFFPLNGYFRNKVFRVTNTKKLHQVRTNLKMYKGKFDLIWSLADPVTQTAQLPNYTAFDVSSILVWTKNRIIALRGNAEKKREIAWVSLSKFPAHI